MRRPLDYLALTGLVLFVLAFRLAFTPAAAPIPNRDSGVFLHVAQAVLDGGLPYADAWDQKPPGIHYIGAAGLALAPGSLWGVWLLETLALAGAAILSYIVLKDLFGRIPALFGASFWLLPLPLIYIDNMPESWGLLVNWIVLFLFIRDESKPRILHAALIGLCAALLLLLKPTTAGAPALIVSLLLLRSLVKRNRADAVRALIILASAALIVGAVLLYFAWRDGLDDFFSSVVLYNRVYARPSFEQWIAFLGTIRFANGFALIGLAGAAILLFDVIDNAQGRLTRPQRSSAIVMLGSVVFIAFMNVASGYGYSQYFIPFLQPYAYLAAYIAYLAITRLRRPVASALLVLLLVPSVSIAWTVARSARWELSHLQEKAAIPISARDEVVAFMESQILSEEPVLIWGIEAGYYVLSQRFAPSRYAISYPLATRSYATPEMAEEFLRELRANPPVYIIDAATKYDGLTPPIEAEARGRWLSDPPTIFGATEAVQAFFEFVDANYVPVTTIRSTLAYDAPWTVYRYQPAAPPS